MSELFHNKNFSEKIRLIRVSLSHRTGRYALNALTYGVAEDNRGIYLQTVINGGTELSTYDDLMQQYKKAQEELNEALAGEQRVEQQRSSVAGEGALRFIWVEHPEVQQAWERTKRAREAVIELRRQLRECLT